MRTNALRSLWRSGGAAVNGWLAIANSFSAETMAHQGWDSLTIDMQHGVVDYHDAVAMLTAISTTATVPVVRVPWNEPGILMKMLDAGAYGLICPMVNTREDAERLVSYVRYPPVGTRSFGPTRANFSAGADYGREADREMICLAMIETAEAFANLAEIVATPGLDGVYIGPADLTLGLTGRRFPTGFDRVEPELVEAIGTILDTAHQAGIRACLHNGSPAYAAKAIGWGFDLVTVSNDVRLLADAARASVETTRRLTAGAGES